MILVHGISPELAEHHTSRMNIDELARRAWFYAGAELSVTDPHPRAAKVSPTQAGDPRNDDGMSVTLNPVSAELVTAHARVGEKGSLGQMAATVFVAAEGF